MTHHPDPLTPADADLRGMPYMPLDIVRMFDSDFYALSTGDEFKAGLSLWCKAFLQRPAGSLPDDERLLAHLSGAGANWPAVRDVAMRGWIKCSDGRLYHETVAEKVNEAWKARQEARARTAAARAARQAARANSGSTPPPTATVSVTENATDNVTPLSQRKSQPLSLHPSKGTGTGIAIGKKEDTLLRSGTAVPAAPAKARDIIWSEGLSNLRDLTGVSDRAARAMLGRWLRSLRDDAAVLAAILAEAADRRPVDPNAWITAAVQSRAGPRSALDDMADRWDLPTLDELDAYVAGTTRRLQ